MSLRINPGPLVGDLLFLQNEHRSCRLFTDIEFENKDPLYVRRGDKNLWKQIQDHPIHPTVREIINDAGFGGLLDCGYHTVDHALVTALVERWRPETHTFHLTVGEATVTLQDVNVLWGLPVEGQPLSGTDHSFTMSEHIQRCQDLLGFTPANTDLAGGRLKLVSLFNELETGFPENPTYLQCTQRARLIILYLCGGTLFPDSTNNRVPLLFLNNLLDLTFCSQYSWGGAVLACLYRNLCKATHTEAKEICGPVYLLQLWALERFPDIAPSINSTYSFNQPIGYRWFKNLSYRRSPSHVLKSYRSELQSLRMDRFTWTPYDAIIQRLPPICRSGNESWSSNCFLICWEIVEPHVPSRVTRQFGILQEIPTIMPLSMDDHYAVHKINRSEKGARNWLNFHAPYVSSWENRHENTIEGQHTMTPTVSPDYMRWYTSRTVLYITNPGSDEVNQHGVRNDGGAYQLMMEGMTQIFQSTRQFVGDNPEAQDHFRFIENTVTQVMELANEEHRLALPSHLTTQPNNPHGMENVSQVGRGRARRRSTRNLVDEGGPLQFQNFQQGESSNPQNFEFVGTSNFNQEDQNTFNDLGSPYVPVTEPQNSPNNSYVEFGVQNQTQMDFMLTPNIGTPFGTEDWSQFNIFAPDQSHMEPPSYSNVSPVPLNLSLGMRSNMEENEDNDGGNNQRR